MLQTIFFLYFLIESFSSNTCCFSEINDIRILSNIPQYSKLGNMYLKTGFMFKSDCKQNNPRLNFQNCSIERNTVLAWQNSEAYLIFLEYEHNTLKISTEVSNNEMFQSFKRNDEWTSLKLDLIDSLMKIQNSFKQIPTKNQKSVLPVETTHNIEYPEKFYNEKEYLCFDPILKHSTTFESFYIDDYMIVLDKSNPKNCDPKKLKLKMTVMTHHSNLYLGTDIKN